MRLFLSIEAQNCTQNGLASILNETIKDLSFLTDKSLCLEDNEIYGNEFREIAIIPSCIDDGYWDALGWKERKQIWRKKREADIRLRMNYKRFIQETPDNQRLLFVDIIVKSIQVVQERSKGTFKGDDLIRDILLALNVSFDDLEKIGGQGDGFA